ncbi:sensor domain-containing protein [Thiohalocapsa marina]|uniref:sensor domain-containing protein n=1 Tax=Thiohalocapsa marina TaxID=424902 RepID=UPI0014788890|nr:EAL domain-containing protein [Thiohalocapsa marina]
MTIDLAESERPEQALRELAANFQTFFETVGDIILVVAPAGHILYANQACQRILGYSRAELSQLQVLDLHPPEVRAEARDIFAAMLRGERQLCPLPLIAKDGALVPVETRVWPGRWNGTDCIYSLIKNLSAEQEAKQRFERLFHHNPAPMALTSLPERRFADVNQAFLERLGYRREEVLGQRAADLDLFPDRARQQRLVQQLIAGERISNEELKVRCKDGALLDGLFSGELIRSQGRAYLLTVMLDITERTRAEQKLRDSEQRYRALSADLERQVQARTAEIRAASAALQASEEQYRMLFNSAADPIFIIDLQGRFLAVNDQACRHYGWSHADFLARHLRDLDTPEDSINAPARIAQLAQQGQAQFQAEHRDAHGRRFPVDARATKIHYGGVPAMLAICRDISEQIKAQERIAFLAYHDPLTGLPNRVLGRDQLAQALVAAADRQRGLAVLLLDLDRFRHVNDAHGQAIGDALLQAVAERLRRQLPSPGHLSRLAGDEFLIVLPDLAPAQAEAEAIGVCERLLQALSAPFDLAGRSLSATASLGVALYPQHGADAEALLLNASIALREAERSGRNRFRCFEAQMNAALMRFVQTREALALALQQQAFELHYQPQLDLRTGAVIGVEALLRWQRPGVGLVLPDAFIDVAEDSGLIEPIGAWVLEQACRQAAAWRAAGWPSLVMSVNLSAVQFQHGQLVETVAAALANSGLAPQGLELELTESIVLQEDAALRETLAQWKCQGIGLAIDDFGTGYASFAYLKRFHIDRLKIDRSFVSDLQSDDGSRAIVAAIIQMARSLGLRIIAEGVETLAIAAQLQGMGCDAVQGYLYARPMPAPELERWLQARDNTAQA